MRSRQYCLTKLLDDTYLAPYQDQLAGRATHAKRLESQLAKTAGTLRELALGHLFFGLHKTSTGWVFREWAPNATAISLIGEFSNWQESGQYQMHRLDNTGQWELTLTNDALHHGQLYRLRMHWPDGSGDRIPAWCQRAVQDHHTKIFNAQVWAPSSPYQWEHDYRVPERTPLIYEAHVGMAMQTEGVGTYTEFRDHILPRIAQAGYNTIQLMAIMEHPYYGSFGYQVSSFFAPTSRCGTPEELKSLIDAAHGLDLTVVIDLIHSHSVRNDVEGLGRFDGTSHQYFHAGDRGIHPAWDSCCFDYGKSEVLHFLLSNCRYWLDEFRVDGFRFDGITSMLYHHHGLGRIFTDYSQYFDDSVDRDALAYLTLANTLIHDLRPDALTIAEDMSGMPGLGAPADVGGCGFDYRLALGVPDCWFKLVRDVPDDEWPMGHLWHELTNRRSDEQTISYLECHDQAIVGSKTFIFELLDATMYTAMHRDSDNIDVDRGIALHKIARLATAATAADGYLNFMGNEFGHPEWIDFPREGNNWSFWHARRQWQLVDDAELRYAALARFDQEMLTLLAENDRIANGPPTLLEVHETDKIVAFRRCDLVFLFNFHPQQSLTDRAIAAPAGEYKLVLDSDAPQFGGHGRVTPNQCYFTQPTTGHGNAFHVYLPTRTALVLRRVSK